MPSLLCDVAATGQTFSHGALSQCWQSIGWNIVWIESGSLGFPVKYLSIRIQCISWNLSTSFFPTTGTLFSALHAITQAPQPKHALRSIDIPHFAPGLSYTGYGEPSSSKSANPP